MARGPAIELLWQQLPQRYWIRDGAAVCYDRPVGSLRSGHVAQVPAELVILAVWLGRVCPGTRVFVDEAAARAQLDREIDHDRRSEAVTELEQLLLLARLSSSAGRGDDARSQHIRPGVQWDCESIH